MSERPLITSRGRITATREPGRLYEIEMPNGFRALAVLPREVERPPIEDATGWETEVRFSPYDMSRCRIAAWVPR